MKKALPLYFAAVTLLIISTGTAQTETLSKWLPHLKKAARQTELHSWRCDSNNNKKKFLHVIAYLFCSLTLYSCKQIETQRERGGRDRYIAKKQKADETANYLWRYCSYWCTTCLYGISSGGGFTE